MTPKILKTKEFLKVYSTQIFFSGASIFGWTLVYLYLVLKGFSYFDLGLFTVAIYVTPLLVLLKTRTTYLVHSMQIGIIIKILTFAGIVFADTLPVLILAGILLGISRVFYLY